MNSSEIEILFQELKAIKSDRPSTLMAKRMVVNEHVFFLTQEKDIPFFLLPIQNQEVSAFSKLSINSFNFSKRKIQILEEPERDYLLMSVRKLDDVPILYKVLETFFQDFKNRSGDSLTICLLNLKRWKNFWSQSNPKGMSDNELLGLYGELLFLKKCFEINGLLNIHTWVGPFGADHDFVSSKIDFEIKTTKASQDLISISNIRQLDISEDKSLMLLIFEISESKPVTSFMDLVNFIDSKCEADEQEVFWTKLTACGYRPDETTRYEGFAFDIKRILGFEVTNDFPRIISSSFIKTLDNRIRTLSYSLDIKGLQSCDEKYLTSKIKDFN
jgi:hypothetical protein